MLSFAVGASPIEIVLVWLAVDNLMLCWLRSGQTFLEAYKTVDTVGDIKDPDARSVCSLTTIPFLVILIQQRVFGLQYFLFV